jgi:hypothetical protein
MKQNKESLGSRKQRVLKVQGKLHSRRSVADVVLPEIRLSGKWLEENGFPCGSRVRVVCDQNKITILNLG